MKRLAVMLIPLAMTLPLASATLAQGVLPDVPDPDGSGSWSLAELQALWPDLTDAAFLALDANADGAVDPAELQAALDAGTIAAPASGG